MNFEILKKLKRLSEAASNLGEDFLLTHVLGGEEGSDLEQKTTYYLAVIDKMKGHPAAQVNLAQVAVSNADPTDQRLSMLWTMVSINLTIIIFEKLFKNFEKLNKNFSVVQVELGAGKLSRCVHGYDVKHGRGAASRLPTQFCPTLVGAGRSCTVG